ncbi:enoyl-CoA hydratase-related protein [Candidatus Nitrotoga sp. M5]|uniref:enoyl-CoA hydratase-related protein n=1 Tax=Candidatus Nitrotoga sp. M5 TaxID=2890409 RepID=UPI001EF55809|nr:enoyl-CoA hydratase-related protein [Candidatus Nitrotoga sp. M5]
MQDYEDLIYEVRSGAATITINRPDKLNALRSQTFIELLDAVQRAAWDKHIHAIVLTGAGDRAFCVGGDTGEKKHERVSRGVIGVPLEDLHSALRDAPKPTLAKVRGFAIGGGNVLATVCDLTIAAKSSVFGQVGPKVGSVDPGWGTAYLSRIIGEKKSREFWFMCRRYSADEAMTMGLVNKVVADERLDAEVNLWCEEIGEKSPTALAIAKRSFNADSENIRGIGALGFQAVSLYYGTNEQKEHSVAFKEKRKPKRH